MKKLWILFLLCIALVGCSSVKTNIKPDSAENSTVSAQPNTKKPSQEKTHAATQSTVKPTSYPAINPNRVYWVPNGDVYHSTDKCSYISGKSYIKHGTIKEAESVGKNRPCSRCGNGK